MFSPLVIDDVTLHINTHTDKNTYIIPYDCGLETLQFVPIKAAVVLYTSVYMLSVYTTVCSCCCLQLFWSYVCVASLKAYE